MIDFGDLQLFWPIGAKRSLWSELAIR